MIAVVLVSKVQVSLSRVVDPRVPPGSSAPRAMGSRAVNYAEQRRIGHSRSVISTLRRCEYRLSPLGKAWHRGDEPMLVEEGEMALRR
jgi:hypothetical protein